MVTISLNGIEYDLYLKGEGGYLNPQVINKKTKTQLSSIKKEQEILLRFLACAGIVENTVKKNSHQYIEVVHKKVKSSEISSIQNEPMGAFVVMQGNNYSREKENGLIEANQFDEGNKIDYHRELIIEVRKGEIIFSVVKGKIKSILVAESDGRLDTATQKYSASVVYHDLESPVDLTLYKSVIASLRNGREHFPFDKNGTSNSQYLFKSVKELTNFLIEKIKENNPNMVLSFLDVIGTSSKSLATLEGAKMEDYNLLYFGAPGTGKSFKAKVELKNIISSNTDTCTPEEKEHKYSERVTFRADSTYGNFVGSYKPVPNASGKGITYQFVPGPFMRLYVQAWKNPDKKYVLLIEELNRAEAAAVFGDVFQLLDRYEDGFSEYSITTSEEMKGYISKKAIESDKLNDWKTKFEENHADDNELLDINSIVKGEIMILPPNLYIRATMNSADQGVFPIDTAFKRRWSSYYVSINDGESLIPETALIEIKGNRYRWNDLRNNINNVLKRSVNEDKLMGPFFIKRSEMKTIDSCTKAFKNKVLDYLVNDAGKMILRNLFSNVQGNKILLSEVILNFETNGLDAFSSNISGSIFSISEKTAEIFPETPVLSTESLTSSVEDTSESTEPLDEETEVTNN